MPKSLFTPAVRAEVIERLGALTPESQGRWGRMTVGQMLCHLTDVYGALYEGRGVGHPGRRFFRGFPAKHIFLYLMRFPRDVGGIPRAAFRTQPDAFAPDRERVQAQTAVFAEQAGRNGWPGHPYFGPMTGPEWGLFAYKHVDHHLRQFGA